MEPRVVHVGKRVDCEPAGERDDARERVHRDSIRPRETRLPLAKDDDRCDLRERLDNDHHGREECDEHR
jgi:hypothetical protein